MSGGDGHCFFPASRGCAEKEDGNQNGAEICGNLCSYGSRSLRKVGTERIRQVLTASTAMQGYAASTARAAQMFFTVIREKVSSVVYFNRSKFLQGVVAKKKAAAKSLLQSVPTAISALHRFRDTDYVCSCLQDCSFYARLHRKAETRIKAAVQLMTGAWSALSSSIGLENL